MSLAQQSCQPCEGKIAPLSSNERERLLAGLPDWSVQQQQDNAVYLSRSFRFKNYRQAMTFANGVAELAEQENHHPRLTVEWGQVTVDWWTHTINGLHINDFILAARCDQLKPS